MRRLILLLSGLVIVLGVVGCQQQAVHKGVEVNIEGGGGFPQEMVGVWQGSWGSWEITFEADGSISSVVIPQGRTRLVPKEPTTVRLIRVGGKGVYEPGVWSVNYIPDSRDLMVEIVVKNFEAEIGNDILRGNIRYMLTGQVNEDYRLWTPSVVTYPKYFVYLDGKSDPNELPVDPNDLILDVIFEKAGSN